MARIDTLTNFLTDVADSIRSKTGKSDAIACEDFDAEIESIETGGGEEPEKGIFITSWNSDGYPANYTIKDMQIPQYCFYSNNDFSINAHIQNINIKPVSKTITSIPQYAFYRCVNLNKINLPNTLTSIENYAFYSCINLLLNELPSSVTKIGENAFNGCANISFETLSNDITSLDNNVFANCTNLKLSKLPDNLAANIGVNCFLNCSNITISKIPDGVTINKSLSSFCFQGCTSITEMDCNLVMKVGSNIFKGCTNLKKIKLSKFASNSYEQMFADCTSLEKIDTPLMTSLGNYICSNCTSLEKVAFISLKFLGTGSFANCTSLKSLNALKFVTTFSGSSATNGSFYNCFNLEAIWIGENVTSNGLPRYVFNGCTSLEKIYINLPRATVQAFTNYQYTFMNDTSKTGIIICNDDNNFITADEFDELYGRDDIETINNCDYLFHKNYGNYHTLYTIENALKYLKPTTAKYMFSERNDLSGPLDLTSLDVKNCSDFTNMFQSCNNITNLNVSNWDTSNATSMLGMFSGYANNSNTSGVLDLSNFTTNNVTDMRWLFYNTRYLKELDISNFDFSNVNRYDNIFDYCGNNVSGGCKVYVKDAIAQNWVINRRPTTWTTDNVIIAGSEADLRS